MSVQTLWGPFSSKLCFCRVANWDMCILIKFVMLMLRYIFAVACVPPAVHDAPCILQAVAAFDVTALIACLEIPHYFK